MLHLSRADLNKDGVFADYRPETTSCSLRPSHSQSAENSAVILQFWTLNICLSSALIALPLQSFTSLTLSSSPSLPPSPDMLHPLCSVIYSVWPLPHMELLFQLTWPVTHSISLPSTCWSCLNMLHPRLSRHDAEYLLSSVDVEPYIIST